jgi:hypothetical protein
MTKQRDSWKQTLGQVFIEREYDIETDGEKSKVVVRFGKPLATPGGLGGYYCVYRILGLGTPHTSCVFGGDALQAFYLAVEIALVRSSARTSTWLGGSHTSDRMTSRWASRCRKQCAIACWRAKRAQREVRKAGVRPMRVRETATSPDRRRACACVRVAPS